MKIIIYIISVIFIISLTIITIVNLIKSNKNYSNESTLENKINDSQKMINHLKLDLQNDVKNLQTSFNTLSSDWDKEKSILDKTNSDVVEQLTEIKKNWGEIIKSGDKMTLQYDGKWKGSHLNGGDVITDPYRLMAPMQCEDEQGEGGIWSSCNMGFSKGGGEGGGWSIHKDS